MSDVEARPLEDLFDRALAPMEQQSALREGAARAEFAQMLRDPRVQVYTVNDVTEGSRPHPVAVGVLARDVSIVNWVQAPFYVSRWPEAHAEGRLYYVPFVVVAPEWQGRGPVSQVLTAMIGTVSAERAVVGFDVNAYNEEARGFVRAIQAALDENGAPYSLAPVDYHTFYAATFDGTPAGGADRRKGPPRR